MKDCIKYIFSTSVVLVGLMALSSCGDPDPQSPGYEYMPDMYRSPAIEAYVDYGMDPFYFGDSISIDKRTQMSVREPAEGTIHFSTDPSKAMFNMPYPYLNTENGYERAGEELKNPIPITQDVLAQGGELYLKFCVHCHGETGQADGPVVENGGHAPPTAYNGDKLKDLPEGKMFHVITYGKNMMGSHAQQLNKEERWKVIHYVQMLQNDNIDPFASDSTTAEMAEVPEDGSE